MFAESGASPPPGLGTSTPEQVARGTLRAIEADKVEVAVAPARQRFLAHFGLATPAFAVRVVERRRRTEGGGRDRRRAFEGQEVETTTLEAADEQQQFLRRPFDPRGERARLRGLPARRSAGALRRRPPSLLGQGPARERAAAGGRRLRQRRRRRGDRRLGRGRRAQRRDPLPAGAGADAGLHRRARRGRPGGDARRDGGDRRRPGGDQPAGRRRPRDRPLGPGRRLRQRRRLRRQRRARLRAQPRALLVPQVGPAVLRQLPRGAAGDRDLPPGQPRAPGPGRLQPRGRGRAARLSRHPGRHRLAHDDGQRPRRARLGRRRDRGRGGDARPTDLDAAAPGGRLQARRRAARGGDRDRSRPHRDRDAARARRRLQVRRVLRSRPGDLGPRRPGDAGQHVAGVRLDLRDLPGRRRDPALSRPDRAADRDDRAGRRLRPRAGHVPRREHPRPGLLRPAGARPGRRSCPASPARNGPRTGCRSPRPRSPSSR